MVMAGKRLVTAGLLVATLTVAAAVWGAPNTTRAIEARLVRQAKTTSEWSVPRGLAWRSGPFVATVRTGHGPAAGHAAWRSATQPAAGAVPAVGVLIGLVLAGMALAARRRAVPVVARPAGRGRAPPARTDLDHRF
jgi:hypothetical protein